MSASNLSNDDQDRANIRRVVAQLETQLINQESLIRRLYIALLTGGHVLIEGPPGLAKTRAVNRFAQSVSASFARVQSTPDLLPADITGTELFQQKTSNFEFLKGPLFNNIVLVDEVNRAPPKVQSAMLEAMGEKQITSSGVTRKLDALFMVAATQNPIEHEGTYPLPEAQKDRFMFFIDVAMPDADTERLILDTVLAESEDPNVHKLDAIDTDTIVRASESITGVHISDSVRDYIVRLIAATRGQGIGGQSVDAIRQASSPRGSIFLATAAKAEAWLSGRDYVTPDDVASLAVDVLSGRIALEYKAIAEGVFQREIISQVVQATPKV